MIVSMTGFGKSVCRYQNKTFKIEIRSLNSKNLDLNIKMPNTYREQESVIRNMLSKALERGKVELAVSLEQEAGESTCTINRPLLRNYFNELKSVAEELGTSISDDFLPDLLRLPDVLSSASAEPEPKEWECLSQGISDAIENIVAYRSSEGSHMADDLMKREGIIRGLLEEIIPFEKDRVIAVREKILRSLKELGEKINVDENRFEQEIIYYLEKLDITEEKVRLRKHLDYFVETMDSNEAGGKKLGFIAQEIGREINTIGSKANDARIQRIVVQMKDELEKIKEQLMNVL